MNRSEESRRLHRLFAAWPLAALGLIIAVAPPQSPSDVDASQFEAGMRIAIDPISGSPVGVPAGDAFPSTGLNRSSAGLTQYRLPGGGYGADLQGRFMSATMVRVNDVGELEHVCTEDHDHALDFVNNETEPVEWEVR